MPGVGGRGVRPEKAQFKSDWDFASGLGLVQRQNSTGGKARLEWISKTGQSDIRPLLIICEITRLICRAHHKVPAESLIGRKLASKPKMLVGIVQANRNAWQI